MRASEPCAHCSRVSRLVKVRVGRAARRSSDRGQMTVVHKNIPLATDLTMEVRQAESLLKAGALQSAIFNSANFSSIATDAKGVIQIFNVGAERMLGYAASE